MRLGHERRAAFLAVDDEADLFAVSVKAVEHGQVALARHAEHERHALRDQAFDDQMAGQLAGVRLGGERAASRRRRIVGCNH